MHATRALRLLGFVGSLVIGCADVTNEEEQASSEGESTIDTTSANARAQYDRDTAFVEHYKTTCAARGSRKRVLVSGFSGSRHVADNASGTAVAALIPDFAYPTGAFSESFPILDPAKATAVRQATIMLPGIGEVDVCAMILPVTWDVPAILIAKEAQAFAPDFVLMTGQTGSGGNWLELGSVNRASGTDVTSALYPISRWYEKRARIISGPFQGDDETGNLLSWTRAQSALRSFLEREAGAMDGDRRFGAVVRSIRLAGFPRSSNTYLCNNTTYIVNYLMDHPEESVTLHRASPPIDGRTNELEIAIDRDLRKVPRVFFHMSYELSTRHRPLAAEMLKTLIAAQLSAPASDPPTRGANKLADPELAGD